MKNYEPYGVIKYTATGFFVGNLLVITGILFDYAHGFKGPWFNIFEFDPNFMFIAFSPMYLSLLLLFIWFKKDQFITHNQYTKLLAKIMGQLNEAIVVADATGKLQWVNDGFIKMHGYDLTEVIGQKIDEILMGPLTNKKGQKLLVEKLENGDCFLEELLVYHKNNSTKWISLSIKPMADSKGKIRNIIAIHNDITIRKEKEFAIEILYKEMADNKFALDQGAVVIKFSIDGKIIQVNNKYCDLNELDEASIIGKKYLAVNPGKRDEALYKPMWDALYRGETWKGELLIYNFKDEIYWADTTIVPIMDSSNQPYQFISIQKNITARKTLEKQLAASTDKFKMAMKMSGVGSWDLEANGRFELSVELRKLYQLPLTGYVSIEKLLSNIHPEDLVRVKEKIAYSLSTFQPIEIEYRYRINNEFRYMLSTNIIRLNEAGKYIGSFGTVQDITPSKLTKFALEKSEAEKFVLLNSTQTIVCLHEMDGTLIDINPSAEKMSGFNKAEVIGLNLKLIINPKNGAEFMMYLQQINNVGTMSGIAGIVTKAGEHRVWLYQNTVYTNADKKSYVMVSAIDITALVKARNELEKQQQFIHQIIDNSPNIVFIINDACQIILCNRTFMAFYPHNKTGLTFTKHLSKGESDIFLHDKESLLTMAGGQTSQTQGYIRNDLTGKLTWFTIINKCFIAKNGKKNILCLGIDMTHKHLLETNLLQANEKMKNALKVKDDFVNNISHEIKTPLNAVIGFTNLLSETLLDDVQTEYIDIVKTASSHLLNLINNILDLSTIESKSLILESLPVNFSKIVTEIVKNLKPAASIKGVQILIHFDRNLPTKVLGDELRLTQLIFNLLDNAIKFTDRGFIKLFCKLINGSDPTKRYFAFSITDTGIGIPKEKQANIFDRFTQAHSTTHKLYGGTGVGLSITKDIIELYGGKIEMFSEPGKGTAFNIVIPLQQFVDEEV